MLTKYAYTCERCGTPVYRLKTDVRLLPPVGDRDCGMCGHGEAPSAELVKVGKCKGCGGPVYKPRGLRGRNPHRCVKCRQDADLRS